MTQTVTSVAAIPPAASAVRAGRDGASTATASSAAPAPPSTAAALPGASPASASAAKAAPSGPAPLTLSVAKGDNGVFVYTLSDPGTGAVVAVIPRMSMQGEPGAQVDQKV